MPKKEQYRKNPAKYQRVRREYYKKHQQRARAASRQWRAENRKKHRAYQRGYYRKHKPQAARYQQAWYRKHRAEVKARARKWAKNNRERRKQIGRAWEHTTHGRINKQKNTATRRARLRKGGVVTAKQWAAKLHRYGHRCARCRRSKNIELHHIKPLADGGRNTIRNVLPLCHPCHVLTHRELKKCA